MRKLTHNSLALYVNMLYTTQVYIFVKRCTDECMYACIWIVESEVIHNIRTRKQSRVSGRADIEVGQQPLSFCIMIFITICVHHLYNIGPSMSMNFKNGHYESIHQTEKSRANHF